MYCPEKFRRFMTVVHREVTERDWDAVYCIAGGEGTGKSNLLLHGVEEYYVQHRGKVLASDAQHVCLDAAQFLKDLRDAKQFEMTGWDEAGDLTNRRTMSKFNVLITQAYKVIRGDNLVTFLVLPSLWDLDSYFVRHRIKGLFVVDKRGHYQFWSKKRLEYMVAMNSSRWFKSYSVVQPTYSEAYKPYQGVLLAEYKKKKMEKMAMVRKQLYKELVKEERQNAEDATVDEQDVEDMETEKEILALVRKMGEGAGWEPKRLQNILENGL